MRLERCPHCGATLPTARELEIIQLISEGGNIGVSIDTLAEHFGLSKNSVYTQIHKLRAKFGNFAVVTRRSEYGAWYWIPKDKRFVTEPLKDHAA